MSFCALRDRVKCSTDETSSGCDRRDCYMLAHLLRSILFVMFAVGCACLWYFRAEAWWFAWAGFWFPPVALASVLALEFVLARIDGLPQLTGTATTGPDGRFQVARVGRGRAVAGFRRRPGRPRTGPPAAARAAA